MEVNKRLDWAVRRVSVYPGARIGLVSVRGEWKHHVLIETVAWKVVTGEENT